MDGNSFSDMEKFLADSTRWHFESKKKRWKQVSKADGICFKDISYEEMRDVFGDLWPSNSHLEAIFLKDFACQRELYEATMAQLVGAMLSMDHTFKVSTNIGYVRASDNKWVKVYDGLFCVLNEYGQVVAFKMTPNLSFAAVSDLLEQVRDRLNFKEDTKVKLIVDNCCSWRRKLQEVFGVVHSQVFLDLFHGVKRISDTFDKGNPYTNDMLRDLRCVFRAPGDYDTERMQPTPDVGLMKQQMKAFVDRWSRMESCNEPLLREKTCDALKNLQKHIDEGCLSEIPPGYSTGRNERLHEFLNNSALNVPHMGPELAHAILSVMFYKWNRERKSSSTVYDPIPPIWSVVKVIDIDEGVRDMEASECGTDNLLMSQMEVTNESEKGKMSTNLSEQSGIYDPIPAIHDRGHTLFEIYMQIKSRHPKIHMDIDWFALNTVSLWNHGGNEGGTFCPIRDYGKGSVGNVMAFGFRCVVKPGLAILQCIWNAVLTAAQEDELLRHSLASKGIDTNCDTQFDMPEIDKMGIRKSIVLGLNGTFDTETNSAALIDILQEMANQCELPLVAIHSSPLFRYVPFFPCGRIVTTKPVYISVETLSPAKFVLHEVDGETSTIYSMPSQSCDSNDTPSSAQLMCQKMKEVPEKEVRQKVKKDWCRCGEKSKRLTVKIFCVDKNTDNMDRKYPCRCKCLKGGRGCSSLCKCHGCGNPHGTRNGGAKLPIMRKVKRQSSRKGFKLMKSVNYLQQEGANIPSGKWTDLETIMFYQCVYEEYKLKRHGTIVLCHKLLLSYREVHNLCKSRLCFTHAVTEKRLNQVYHKQKYTQQRMVTIRRLIEV